MRVPEGPPLVLSHPTKPHGSLRVLLEGERGAEHPPVPLHGHGIPSPMQLAHP